MTAQRDAMVQAVAEAIVASMEEQCDFAHVGLIGAHVSWQKVAEAAVQALGLTQETKNIIDPKWTDWNKRLIGTEARWVGQWTNHQEGRL